MPPRDRVRAHGVAFLIGATVGVALDAIHTHSGTTLYAREVFLRMAWWTPPLFGGAAVALLGAHVQAERALDRPIVPRHAASAHALAALAFVLAYAASGYLPASNGSKAAVLWAVWLAGFAFFGRSLPSVGLAVAAAVLGPLVEITLVSRGLFLHLQPDVLGVPVWLPALYACASVLVGPLGLALHGAWASAVPFDDAVAPGEQAREQGR